MTWVLINVFTNERIAIQKEIFLVGRENGDLICKCDWVSRSHAKFLILKGGSLILVDIGSVNGTYINNKKIEKHIEIRLNENDEIGFGLSRNEDGTFQNEKFQPPYHIYRLHNEIETFEILDSDDEKEVKKEAMQNNYDEDDIDLVESGTSSSNLNNIPTTRIQVQNVIKFVSTLPEDLFSEESTLVFEEPEEPEEPQKKEKGGKNGFIKNGYRNGDNNYPKRSTRNKNEAVVSTSRDVTKPTANGATRRNNSEAIASTSHDVPILLSSGYDKINYNMQNINNSTEVVKDNRHTSRKRKSVDNVELDVQDSKQMKVTTRSPEYIRNDQVSNNFSSNDDIIEIDDDNDDIEFICSQLYVKPEPSSELPEQYRVIGDELYYSIKKEIAEMDAYGDQEDEPPIIIHDEPPDWESDDDNELIKELSKIVIQREEDDSPILVKEEQSDNDENDNYMEIEANENLPDNSHSIPEVDKAINNNRIVPDVNEKKAMQINKSRLKQAIVIDIPLTPKSLPKQKVRKEEHCIPSHSTILSEPAVTKTREEEVEKKSRKEKPKTDKSRSLPEKKLSSSREIVRSDKYQSRYNQHHQIPLSFVNEYIDIIQPVLEWNKSWFEEQKKCKSPPPVHGNSSYSKEIRMCTNFANFEDYYKVLRPLMIIDYWFNLCKEYDETSYTSIHNQSQMNDNFFCRITETRQTENYTELVCFTYLSQEVNDLQIHVRDKNLVLLNVRFKSGVKQRRNMFGVVKSTYKERFSRAEAIEESMEVLCKPHPFMKLNMVILVKNCAEEYLKTSPIVGRYFNSFPQFLKLVGAVKALKTSPLLEQILEPNYEDFKFPESKDKPIFYDKGLNGVQKKAVLDSMALYDRCNGLYLIEGPPGTGKSTVIISIILEILRKKDKNAVILLLAPSNGAIDSLVTKLVNIRTDMKEKHISLKLVRIGNTPAISSDVIPYTLEELIQSNIKRKFILDYKEAKLDYEKLCAKVNALKEKIKKGNADNLYRDLKKYTEELHDFPKKYLQSGYNDYFELNKRHVMNGANIICTTIGSSTKLNFPGFEMNRIKITIIDEATQCTEPESLIPVSLGLSKFVLVGDTMQLPAVTNDYCRSFGYGGSLFSRIKRSLEESEFPNPIKLLNVQYRMNPEISHFPNKHFYMRKLKNSNSYSVKEGFEKLLPYLVFYQNVYNRNGEYRNEYEVDNVIKLIEALHQIIRKTMTIGIITPYNNQKSLFEMKLKRMRFKASIVVNTVDGFQGQEKDIIILSCVRNNANSFVSDEQRINVSLTRAKYGLYIIGAQSLFDTCTVMNCIKQNAQERNLYHELKVNENEAFFKGILKKKF